MRHINIEDIEYRLKQAVIQCGHELPEDVLSALNKAYDRETQSRAKNILSQVITNAQIAKEKRIPLCQDTGLAVIFIKQGSKTQIMPEGINLFAVVNQAVKDGYEEGFLRKSVVEEPLNQRKNTQTNTPCVIHYEQTEGDGFEISVMLKGGGCENKSQFKMFNPTENVANISNWIVNVVKDAGANACPPFVVGVGIGGDFEQCCFLAKKSLLREIGSHNSDKFYEEIEQSLLAKINSTGLGAMGLGGNTTALAVMVETAACHIASLPVAVNIECHSHRHKTITF